MDEANGRQFTEEVIGDAVDNIFRKYDANHNDFIDFPEFRKLIEDLNLAPKLRISLREITGIFKLLDVDGDGRVSR
jgi:Ca2+-binding EF-hand superfamily protein